MCGLKSKMEVCNMLLILGEEPYCLTSPRCVIPMPQCLIPPWVARQYERRPWKLTSFVHQPFWKQWKLDLIEPPGTDNVNFQGMLTIWCNQSVQDALPMQIVQCNVGWREQLCSGRNAVESLRSRSLRSMNFAKFFFNSKHLQWFK